MLQKISNVKDIKWIECNPSIQEKDLALLRDIPFKLPKSFIELLKINNGGTVDYEFDYYDLYFEETVVGGIDEIYSVNTKTDKIINPHYRVFGDENYGQQEFYVSHSGLVYYYYHPPEFFPKNLIAFGENGGENKICFDYRQDQATDNPPVVYWISSHDIGEDVSFLANNFMEFLAILREPEPFPGEEK